MLRQLPSFQPWGTSRQRRRGLRVKNSSKKTMRLNMMSVRQTCTGGMQAVVTRCQPVSHSITYRKPQVPREWLDPVPPARTANRGLHKHRQRSVGSHVLHAHSQQTALCI